MSSILTILTFPIPCMGIWEKNPEIINPLDFRIGFGLKPSCEVVLPEMWAHFLPYQQSISGVATLNAPGPFTAVRAGLSFAQGFSHGDNGCLLFSTSFFSLMPDGIRSKIILDTGAGHWVNELGGLIQQTVPDGYRISSATCTGEHMLEWSLALAMAFMRSGL